MTKREISSTLKNLKFMQRTAPRDEEIKEVTPNGNFSSSSIVKKCVMITEGDPHPRQSIGRMSFQCFNPSIDTLAEDANTPTQPKASTTLIGKENGKFSAREDEAARDGFDNLESNSSGDSTSGDLKRKQFEETTIPNRSKKNKPETHRFHINQEAHRGNRKFDKHQNDQKLKCSGVF